MNKLILSVLVLCGAAFASIGVLKDGVYAGQSMGYKLPIKVAVTVEGGKISDIKVTSCRDKFARKVEKEIPRRIVEAGHTDVDVISGATITSRAVKRAVGDALKKAQ